MEMQENLVVPGDKIGVEEEFIAADNTFVEEDGTIRAAIMGQVVKSEGKVSVINQQHNVIKYRRGMFVVGTISDDVKSVMFIKIDNIKIDGKEYIAIKDGKIVNQERRPPGRDFRGPPRGGDRPQASPRSEKPAGVGDVILARILYEDPEIFTLTLNDNESGVVYSNCGLCGTVMKPDGRGLVCTECGNKSGKKVSPLYNNPEAIKRLFAQDKN